jgi:hypothetical protein
VVVRQAAVRHYDELMDRIHTHMSRASLPARAVHNLAWYSSYLIPRPLRRTVRGDCRSGLV